MFWKYKDLEVGDLIKVENALIEQGKRFTGEGLVIGFGTVAHEKTMVWVDFGEGQYKLLEYEDIEKVAPHGDVSHVAG